jgi:8-oxo-dGTP diphosphatase
MQPEDQQADGHHKPRYVVTPRTLVFLTRADQILLLRGAADKRLWAGKYNGLGGHIESGESPYQAAKREVYEESGLLVSELELRAIIHITLDPEKSADSFSSQTGIRKNTPSPGVMLFVFVGEAPEAALHPSEEGDLVWVARDTVTTLALVEDLPQLLPRVLDSTRVVFGHYWFNDAGLQMEFD